MKSNDLQIENDLTMPRKKQLKINMCDSPLPLIRSQCLSEQRHKENRIYIRQSLSAWNGSSKCTNHVNVHKLYAVEYISTVCSLDYPFQFWIF